MYRRYTQVHGDNMSLTQIKRNRIKNIGILLLVLIIIALTVIALPALRYRQEERSLYVQRMQTECAEALRQTAVLSRNAGADTAALLSRIRSNIYAIRIMNNTYNSQTGSQFLPDEQLQSLVSDVDKFLSYLTTGMDTGEYQTNLQNALNNLQLVLDALE